MGIRIIIFYHVFKFCFISDDVEHYLMLLCAVSFMFPHLLIMFVLVL